MYSRSWISIIHTTFIWFGLLSMTVSTVIACVNSNKFTAWIDITLFKMVIRSSSRHNIPSNAPQSIVSSIGSGPSSPSTPISHAPVYLTSYSPRRPWYRPHISFRAGILTLLPLLSLLGAFGTWTLGGTNGTFKSIVALIAQPEAQLPGTNEDLIRAFTWVGFVDKQLSILVTFFAPVVDLNLENGNGALNLFSIFGAGQFGAVWCLMVMESLRMGNHARGARLVSFTLYIHPLPFSIIHDW